MRQWRGVAKFPPARLGLRARFARPTRDYNLIKLSGGENWRRGNGNKRVSKVHGLPANSEGVPFCTLAPLLLIRTCLSRITLNLQVQTNEPTPLSARLPQPQHMLRKSYSDCSFAASSLTLLRYNRCPFLDYSTSISFPQSLIHYSFLILSKLLAGIGIVYANIKNDCEFEVTYKM